MKSNTFHKLSLHGRERQPAQPPRQGVTPATRPKIQAAGMLLGTAKILGDLLFFFFILTVFLFVLLVCFGIATTLHQHQGSSHQWLIHTPLCKLPTTGMKEAGA